jgi:hypothetical protein
LNSIAHDARKEIMKYRIKKLIQILYQNQKKETFIERLELSKTISNQQKIKWSKEFLHRLIHKQKEKILFVSEKET